MQLEQRIILSALNTINTKKKKMLVSILLIATILLIIFILDHHKRNYWKRHGVSQLPSLPFVGNFLPLIKLEKSKAEIYDVAYGTNGKNPSYIGMYEFWTPILVIKDIHLIEKIVVKDMSYFLDHPRWVFDDKTFMGDSIFNLRGNLWRAMRYQMTPSFTFRRLKLLFPYLLNSINIPDTVEVDAVKLYRTLAFDTIMAFFGIQISNKEEFEKINRLLNDVSVLSVNYFEKQLYRFYELLIVEHFSSFSELFGLKFIRNSTDNFVKTFQKNVITNILNDFTKLLNKIKGIKFLKLRSKDLYINSKTDEIYSFEINDRLIEGQAGQFLLAGLDVNANSLMWLTYEIAQKPEIQVKAREEIRKVLKQHNGNWSYLAVQDMKYVAQCVQESLRLHPVLPFLFRTCTTNYTTPDGLLIEKGTKLLIPSLSIHMDEQYYPEPQLYKPERFDDIETFNKYIWLPFGEGPRKCLGMRLAQLVLKVTISRILENHEISLSDKTKIPLLPDMKSFLGAPAGQIYINLKPVA